MTDEDNWDWLPKAAGTCAFISIAGYWTVSGAGLRMFFALMGALAIGISLVSLARLFFAPQRPVRTALDAAPDLKLSPIL